MIICSIKAFWYTRVIHDLKTLQGSTKLLVNIIADMRIMYNKVGIPLKELHQISMLE